MGQKLTKEEKALEKRTLERRQECEFLIDFWELVRKHKMTAKTLLSALGEVIQNVANRNL